MRRLAKIRIAGTIAATLTPLLFCGAAISQTAPDSSSPASQALNSQIQLGDVWATQTLNVDQAPNGASATAVAVGNSATATGQQSDLDFESTQQVQGAVGAIATGNVNGDAGPYFAVTSSATGNSGTAGTCCGATTGTVWQTMSPGSATDAESYATLGGYTDNAAVSAAAIGNTQGWNSVNGSVNTTTNQVNSGTTFANVNAQVCCTASGNYVSSAVANNVTVDSTNSPVNVTTNQTVDGDRTEADLTVNQTYGGDALGTATAMANNVNVASGQWAASVSANQTNGSAVNANSDVSVGQWDGSASSVGYGVGNSVIASNAGSWTGVYNNQDNEGAITVSASLTGGAGGDGFVSATGVGNAVSGYACPECNGTFFANNNQYNNASVRSVANLSGGSLSSANGVSTAVGNTATFQVRSGH